jgi:hypothetical protein
MARGIGGTKGKRVGAKEVLNLGAASAASVASDAEHGEEGALYSDTYSEREYEVALDLLYGLFSREDAEVVRVYDPFIADVRQAPLITPRMLTRRLEAILAKRASA